MKLFAAILMATSFSVYANECAEITKCIEHISKLTGKKYIYDAREVKGGVVETSNVELTKDNADSLFTYILDINGYARVPTTEKDTYTIMSARDIRYHMFPSLNVDSETPPAIVPNHDYYMMNFKFKHYKHGQMREAANSMRPFMSRYARVIELKTAGVMSIQENGTNLIKIYELAKRFDRELTKEEIKEAETREKERREERKSERKEHKEDKKE